MSSSSPAQSTTPKVMNRAEVMERYHRMRKKRVPSTSTPAGNSSSTPKTAAATATTMTMTPNKTASAVAVDLEVVSDENLPASFLSSLSSFSGAKGRVAATTKTPSSTNTTIRYYSTASPLSPKNGTSVVHNKSSPAGVATTATTAKLTPPLPQQQRVLRRDINAATTTEQQQVPPSLPSPSVTSVVPSSPSSTSSSRRSGSARRERLARHARILGNRGRSSTPTPRSRKQGAATTFTKTPTPMSTKSDRFSEQQQKYEKEKTTSSSTTKNSSSLPPMTPMTTSAKNASSSSKSISTVDEVSKRSAQRQRERRVQGAKKLFILATSPSMDDDDEEDDLTPLERHLNSHDAAATGAAEDDDCPSVYSDVSTITMSTLSSLARDRRKFSREQKFSSSKLYARATGQQQQSTTRSVSSSGDETTSVVRHRQRGRSPVRRTGGHRGIVEATTITTPEQPPLPSVSSHSTTSGSDFSGRRAVSLQKARRLARSRSASRRRSSSIDRRQEVVAAAAEPSAAPSSSVSKSPMETHNRRSSSVGRRFYSSPVPPSSSSSAQSVTSTPGSDSKSVSSSRSGTSRATSIEKARRTLARTKPRGVSPKPSPLPPPPPTDVSTSRAFTKRETVEGLARRLHPAPQTRRNLDKRTARLKYHEEFSSEIAKCREEVGKPRPKHLVGDNLIRRGQHGVSIFIRKRPIFDYEIASGDFEVVFTEQGRSDDCDAVVIHSCTMHADMRKMLVKPLVFPCSAAFDETCTNDTLYTHVGRPLVRLVANGGLATLLMYGQTGSGKTHTITGMEERICKDLFRMVTKSMRVTVHYVEIAGKQVRDLLGNTDDVMVVDQENGSTLLLNATSSVSESPNDLYNIILQGKQNRATESTDKNDVSSRSHAVCQITITSAKNEQQRGVLTLIDCAGSERRNDSLYHNRERQKESNEINESLWALKECIRARANGGPTTGSLYRASPLTRILRGPLERQDAQLCVIATVAPTASDTEHSVETIRTVSKLAANENTMEVSLKTRQVLVNSSAGNDGSCPLSPKQWDHNHLVEWMDRKHFVAKDVIPEHVDGKQVMRMNRIQLRNMFFADDDDAEKADSLFNALRSETDKANRAQRERRIALANARAALHEI